MGEGPGEVAGIRGPGCGGCGHVDRIADRRRVEILLEMRRGDLCHLNPFRCEYVGDYMWCDLLRIGPENPEPVGAIATVFFDKEVVGSAETYRLTLSLGH